MDIVYVLFCEGDNDWSHFTLNKDKKGIKGDYTNNKMSWIIYSLLQTSYSNFNHKLHLISNTQKLPKLLKDKVILHNIYDYIGEDCKQFDKIYIHLSTLPYTQELFCFKRAFVLKEFAVKNDIDYFFHVEVDNVVYMNIEEQYKLFKQYDLTLSVERSAHGMWVNNKQALIDYCKMIIDAYTGKYFRFNVENMKKNIQHNIKRGVAGGVTDMHFWQYYYWDHKDTVLPEITTFNRFEDTGIYDRHIRSDLDKWDNEEKITHNNHKFMCKKFTFKDKIPFCKCLKDNIEYPFVTIHFNSFTKEFIKDYINYE